MIAGKSAKDVAADVQESGDNLRALGGNRGSRARTALFGRVIAVVTDHRTAVDEPHPSGYFLKTVFRKLRDSHGLPENRNFDLRLVVNNRE